MKTKIDAMSKAIDELLDEYEVLVKSDAQLSPSGEDGDPIAPGDTKGGLNPKESQGAPASGLGNDPVVGAVGAAAPSGDMGKAEEGGKPSVPPGFKGEDDDKSSGAEDEEDEGEAGDEEGEGSDEGADFEGDDEGSDEGDEGEAGDEEGEDSQFGGDDEGAPGEDDEDPEFDAKVEKGIYKFMEKIGMTGDYAKSETAGAGEALAKSQETLQKSVDDRFSKVEAQVSEVMGLLKSVTEQLSRLDKLAKAPAARPRAVSGIQPLRKSEDEAPKTLSKGEISEKVFAALKAGKVADKNIIAKMDMTRTSEEAAILARSVGVEV